MLGVGGGDWTARLGREPQPLDNPPDGLRHGLGLHAAACLAVNELLKAALVPLGMRALMLPGSDGAWCGDPLVWNLIDYRRAHAPLTGAVAGRVQRLRVLLAGGGSVGTSVAGMLIFCPGLTGEAIVVDPEDFDPARNPLRYPALAGGETGAKATDSLVPSTPAFSVRPTRAMVSSISRGARKNPTYVARHSRTERPGSGSDSCKTTPTRSLQAPPAVAGSCPRTRTCPAARCRKPSRISTVVVLPAPFGPRKSKISPRRTSRSMPAAS